MAKKKQTEAADAEEVQPKSKKRKLVIATLAVVVIGIGGFGYMTLTKHPPAAGATGTTTTAAGPIVQQSSLTVNLRDGHYLQFQVALQLAMGKSPKVLAKYHAIVLDTLISQASSMTETVLLQPGGRAQLKQAMLAALDQKFPGLVVSVFFEQFVMQ